MDEKYNESTINRPKGERLIDAPLIAIDLYKHITQLKTEAAWEKNDRNGITIFKTEGMRIVLVSMHADAEMRPQTIDSIVSIQVLEGHLQFITEEETLHIQEGQIVTMHANIYHSIKAVDTSTFLITMTDENYSNSFLS